MAEAAVTKNVIALSAVVTREVDQDEIAITFETIQSGPDSSQVQQNLNTFLSEALAAARTAFDDNEDVRVETGAFSVSPKYGKKGAIDGYEGTAELIVKGTDTSSIAKFAGELRVMRVADIGHSVSRKTRISLEGEMATAAIAEFRARATQYTKDFGLKSFSLINANVNVNLQQQHRGGGARVMAFAASASMNESAPVAVSAGKEILTAQVSGSIQLK